MARVTQFYDFVWTFADGEVVRFQGVSRMFDLRQRLKDLKRKPEWREKAKRLTNKSFDIQPHPFCPQCQSCPTCKRPLHVCAGHDSLGS